jgi:hypothetical protein
VTGRFKRSLFGYSPGAVDRAFAERDAALAVSTVALVERFEEAAAARRQVDHLEGVCDTLSERVVGRERELAALKAEAVRLRTELERRLDDGSAATVALTALADDLAAIRAQARGQATRIRMTALRDAARCSEAIAELARRPERTRPAVLAEIERSIERLGGSGEEELYEPSANGSAAPSGDVFDGLVEIEVGPLDDFSQLVGFEDAAGGIAATSQISVKRFASGRATLEMQLAEPVELLRELEERAPFAFRVRDRRFDRVVLDVGADGAASAPVADAIDAPAED